VKTMNGPLKVTTYRGTSDVFEVRDECDTIIGYVASSPKRGKTGKTGVIRWSWRLPDDGALWMEYHPTRNRAINALQLAAATQTATGAQAPNPTLCKACHRETPEEYREPVDGGYFCRNCVEDWAEEPAI
jgi:hypothetical protein